VVGHVDGVDVGGRLLGDSDGAWVVGLDVGGLVKLSPLILVVGALVASVGASVADHSVGPVDGVDVGG
jgi:hypothetical protein